MRPRAKTGVAGKAGLVLGLALLLVPISVPPAVSAGEVAPARTPALGVAITPRNTPAHTARDVDEAFALAREIADYAVFIYQWGELDTRVARLMVERSRQAGLTPVLGLSPTSLDRGRKELDVPAEVQRRAGAHLSFAHPVVRAAFRNAVSELAALRPAYLCLATEINFLALQRLDEYLHFASLYKEAYALAKGISPQTKIFVSFQWEWMRILDAREPHRVAEHRKVVDIFRPQLDVVALTTYPSPFHATPADLPPDYYTWVRHHVRADDELLLMEAGWPSGGSGSEREQSEYVARLPALLAGLDVSVVAWALLHDVALAQFDADLNTVGLLTRRGRPKPALTVFEAMSDD